MFNCHKFDYKQGRNGVFGLDKSRRGWYNKPWATDRPKGRPYGAVAFLVEIHRESIFSLFSLSRSFIRRGGDGMYMTWELFFTFCLVVIELLALVVLIFQNNKKK